MVLVSVVVASVGLVVGAVVVSAGDGVEVVTGGCGPGAGAVALGDAVAVGPSGAVCAFATAAKAASVVPAIIRRYMDFS